MKKETVTIENYQQLAMRTCLKSARNRSYAYENYYAELFELYAKMKSYHAKRIRDGKDFDKDKAINTIKDEMGDCFWQLALCCTLERLSFKNQFKKAKSKLFAFVDTRELAMAEQLHYILQKISTQWIAQEMRRIKGFCVAWGIEPIECLQLNIAKLSSRKARGVIKGNGDKR